jgi:hypothetical protein
MIRPDLSSIVHAELVGATEVVRAYSESDGSKAMVKMLDALAQGYAMDIVDCTVNELVHLQSCIKQIYALRAVISNETQNIPKI